MSSGKAQEQSGGQRQTPGLRQATRYFSRLLRLIKPYWLELLHGIAVSLLLGVIGMVSPFVTKLMVDRVYPDRDATLMVVLVTGLLALSLGSVFIGTLNSYFSLFVNTRLNNATRLMFFNHLQHLRARFFDDHQVGEINSRFQDVGQALQAIGNVFQTIFVHGIYLLLVPPVLFYIDWRLALVAIVSLPLSFAVTVFSGPLLRRRWQQSSEAFADLNAFQIESLSHVRTFKTMGLENHVYQRADVLVHHAMDQQLRAGGLSQLFSGANGVLSALNTAIYTWFGWTLILAGDITLGDFLAFSAYVGFLYGPLRQLIQLFTDFQQSAVHLDRMFEYLDSPLEQDPGLALKPPQAPGTRLRGAFSLRGIGFGYQPDQWVLRELNADLPAASITALVGLSGSGKTSLLRLLTALESPGEGEILIDGRPLIDVPLHELRQQIAVVWQDVALIRGSLRENLLLGCTVAPGEGEIQDVVRLCGLEELMASLPEGLGTQVAEFGSTLSAGQRQRVALARALLRRAPILLLDEATANIDVETEMRILRAVFANSRVTTVLYVTHRLASAALADRICVLEHGRVVGIGPHDKLLDSCAPYRRMVQASHDEGFQKP